MTGPGISYSGLDIGAEDFTVPGGTASNNNNAWFTTYIWTAASGWNADTGISKVEFTNNHRQGPGNTVNMRIFFNSFTMPSADKRMYVDVDLGAGVNIPPNVGNGNRNSSLVVSFAI